MINVVLSCYSLTLIKAVSEHKYAVKRCEVKMRIDLNVASYAKMAAFSLTTGVAQNFEYHSMIEYYTV